VSKRWDSVVILSSWSKLFLTMGIRLGAGSVGRPKYGVVKVVISG
jgi:hypothetical protein